MFRVHGLAFTIPGPLVAWKAELSLVEEGIAESQPTRTRSDYQVGTVMAVYFLLVAMMATTVMVVMIIVSTIMI